MIGFIMKCDVCPTTVMYPKATTKSAVRKTAEKDGWSSFVKDGVRLELCPPHTERYNQLVERGK